MNKFSHLDKNGLPAMVNVSNKNVSQRSAVAQCIVVLPAEIAEKLSGGDIQMPKGTVFQTAIIAGIMAAKKTGELIPLCHPLGLDSCDIKIDLNKKNEAIINCMTTIEAKTGVEMEALTGVTVAALTIYDMCKALSHDIIIKEIKLLEKTGGKNNFKRK